MPVKRVGRSKKDQFGAPKRRSHVGRGTVHSRKQSSLPDDGGAQQKVELACQIENPGGVLQTSENVADMPQLRRLAPPGEQAGKSQAPLGVPDDLCPAVGQPIL